VSYEGFNYIQQLRTALAPLTDPTKTVAGAEQLAAAARSLDAALAPLASAGFGIVHRDLGRRYSDQFISDAMPSPSVIAGVDAPCKQLDTTLDGLRKLQATSVAELNGLLSRGRVATLPSWLAPAAPACGPH